MKNRYWQQESLCRGITKILPLLVALFCVTIGIEPLMAQSNFQISGVVKDASNGSTMPGVNVLIKSTSQGTATDLNGKYTLTVSSPQDTLVFSYIGYESKVVPINGRHVVNVSLVSEAIKGQEMVVIGYGVQKRSDLSSSVASVSTAQIQKNATLPNVAQALEGTTAGVNVSPSSGAPGASINIRVRGTNTMGDNNPLVIIDGSPGDLNNVSPEDIQSIQVLKDAAAAAIYGSRAANGVVIVTTKKGHSGQTHVTIQSSYGIQSPTKFIPVANAEQYATIDNALHLTTNGQVPVFDALKNPSSLGVGSDWQNLIYNSEPLWKAYMGISGGQNNNTWRVSGSFNKQNGIATATYYRKALLHYNGQQETGPITFGESISFTDENQRLMPYGGDKDLTQQIILAQPIIPVHDSTNDGGWGGAPGYLATQAFNPLGLIELQKNTNHNDNIRADVYGQFQFLKNFTYKLNAGYRIQDTYYQGWTPTYFMSSQRQNIRATLSETRGRTHHWLIDNTLNWQQTIGKHNFNVLLGFSTEEQHYRYTYASQESFPNNTLHVLDAGLGYSIGAGGQDIRWDLVSEFGRLIYSYGDKYYVTANVRRDGSSRFGSANRYGVFPSVSLGWRVSNESFFSSLSSVITNLKLRGSYGVLGNEPNDPNAAYQDAYAYQPTIAYTPALGYLYGGGFLTGAAQEAFVNPDVKWETTKDLDVGLDAGILNNVTLSADYYVDKTNNVLLNVPVPPSTGTSAAPLVNTGKLQNKGFEVSLTYNSPQYDNNFNYSITGNISTVSNKVVKLGYAGQIIYGAAPHRASTGGVTVAQVGYPIGAFFLKQAEGLFQSQAEIDNYKNKQGQLIQPNAKPGDVKYKDVNGDGMISNADVAYSGSPFPKFSYGLNFSANYKNFDFTLFLQGTYGNKMFDTNTWITNRGTLDYNFSTDLLNAWAPNNTNTNVPRLTFNDPNHNSDPSTRFLYDASYLRFKTAQIGYTLPKGLLGHLGVSRLRVFVNANNLLTITKYPGYDPSYSGDGLLNRGLDQGLYPVARTINGGIDINF